MEQLKRVNILLVDDRPENLVSLSAILEEENYDLKKATSGEEALRWLLKEDFALILLDVKMPGMDGFATAKLIKSREKTSDIPIIFITANSMETKHISMGYSVGAFDYLLKPFDPLVLKAKVARFVEIYQLKQRLIAKKETLTRSNEQLLIKTSQIKFSETLSNVISETSSDAMLVISDTGQILKANKAAEDHLLVSTTKLVGHQIDSFFTQEKAADFLQSIYHTVDTATELDPVESENELTINRADGTTFIGSVHIGMQSVDQKRIIACTIRDITEQKESAAMVKYLAYYDTLTDLPNRHAFQERLEKEISKGKEGNYPISILHLNIDRFKNINDSLGHLIGDSVLVEIAHKINSILSDKDFLARSGGDEYMIILPRKNREEALEVADELLINFQKPITVDKYELFITTSIGLSIFPYDSENGLELVKYANAALYQAKEQGKNKYRVFHAGMNIQSYRSFVLQNDLRKAIELEELEVYFQPKVEIATGRITSAEALLRWNHTNWGQVSPGEFITLAEQTGQMNDIGDWVFRYVIEQMRIWQQKNISPIKISVNFSANQFLEKDLVNTIDRVLTEAEVPASYLEIEITESELLASKDLINNTIDQIRDLGITISIDDFGTGYSSLSYLTRLSVDVLKIDQSFVKEDSSKKDPNRNILRMIIQLAKALNLAVVAEGVETEEQYQFLASEGCDYAQGYLFSRPLPIKEFEKLLEKETVFYHQVETKGRLDNKSGFIDEFSKKYNLSTIEEDVFKLIISGISNLEIAKQLAISQLAVKGHITSIFNKLSVTDRTQAMALVYEYALNKTDNQS